MISRKIIPELDRARQMFVFEKERVKNKKKEIKKVSYGNL